jgi:hypothetical protein
VHTEAIRMNKEYMAEIARLREQEEIQDQKMDLLAQETRIFKESL